MNLPNRLLVGLVLASATIFVQSASASTDACRVLFEKEIDLVEQVKLDLPKGSAVGPVDGLPIRDVILRFLSGLPFPQRAGETMGTREILNLWKNPPSQRWAATSPVILETALSIYGPFGAYGPLGLRQAPLGGDLASPWFWWRKAVQAGAWNAAPRALFEKGGPLNPRNGVLSQMGPDSSAWHQGVLDIFGTNSPLGPKGPLGVLGPMGAVMSLRAMSLDNSGMYIDPYTKQIVNSVLMPNHSRGHGPVDMIKYDIVEDLSAKFSQALSDEGLLDTSFITDSKLARTENEKSFHLTARNSETVTALVIPDKGVMWDSVWLPPRPLNFTIEVRTAQGTLVMRSDTRYHANLIHFQARAGERYEIRVVRQGHSDEQAFRLAVTGSTSYYAKHLWEETLGPSFTEVMELSSEPDRELALNFIWSAIVQQAWTDFAALKKDPTHLADFEITTYWNSNLRKAMSRYDGLRKKAGSLEAARTPLLIEMKKSIDLYRGVIKTANFTGEDILKLYVAMWNGGVEAREQHFNMSVEQAAQVPEGWLRMLDGNYAQLTARFHPQREARP